MLDGWVKILGNGLKIINEKQFKLKNKIMKKLLLMLFICTILVACNETVTYSGTMINSKYSSSSLYNRTFVADDGRIVDCVIPPRGNIISELSFIDDCTRNKTHVAVTIDYTPDGRTVITSIEQIP